MSRINCSIRVEASRAVGSLVLLPAAIIVSPGIRVLYKILGVFDVSQQVIGQAPPGMYTQIVMEAGVGASLCLSVKHHADPHALHW